MKKLKSTALQLWKDESGQGTAEYVLILVLVVALGYVFRDNFKEIFKGKVEAVAGEISKFAG